MNNLRIVIARPNIYNHVPLKIYESLAIAYLGSSLREDGHEVFLLDGEIESWCMETMASKALSLQPELICFTNVLNEFPQSLLKLIELIRDGGFKGVLLFGGHSVSFFANRILHASTGLSGIVCGEGEMAVRYIAKAIKEKGDWRKAPGLCYKEQTDIKQNPIYRIQNLDAIPWPARDLTKRLIAADGVACALASRGCDSRCLFCSIPRFYGLANGKPGSCGIRIERSLTDVADEVLYLHNQHNVSELIFLDDEFFGNKGDTESRAHEFSSVLIERNNPVKFGISIRAEHVNFKSLEKLQHAGLSHVFIGIESGLDADLRFYGKKHTVHQNVDAIQIIKSMGLSLQIGFMGFNYNTTIDSLRKNINFLKAVGEMRFMVIATEMSPYFGTPMVNIAKKDGVLRDDGLSLGFKYLDYRIELISEVVNRCKKNYWYYMSWVAKLQSSVTFRWRRKVPSRCPETTLAIDKFENLIESKFCGIIEWAIDVLDVKHPPSIAELLQELDNKLSETKKLELVKELLLRHVEYA